MDPGTPPRLVLITAVSNWSASATVVLLSPELEQGTSTDRLLRGADTGLGYDVIALPDITGLAWLVQVGPVLGHAATDLDEATVAGVALRDELDGRWRWKENELDALVALTSECRYQLVDGTEDVARVIDPMAFDSAQVPLAARAQLARVATRLLACDQVRLPAQVLPALPVPHRDVSFALWAAVRDQVHRRHKLLLRPHALRDGAAEQVGALRDVRDDTLVAVLWDLAAELPAHVRCITVESVSTLWGSSPHGPEVWYQSVVIGGRRHQVVVSEADRGKAAHV
ncbi:hypothetical protein GCM10023153_31450 [Ornithinibacter aureus]|uniref:Uncharacterized protein n=2 Tax=Ornithinibacter aureus TaxID=622664 RepID=A0ABP8K9Y8_9MICO